ncbi:MAG TPA: hypothetical protein DCF62_01070 [Porticoccaceae bacterium]|nr:hypothetical protein [Porticoccaceae bacterium]HCO60045.1 hypothetical protein [Porticoccaceae bacterium]
MKKSYKYHMTGLSAVTTTYIVLLVVLALAAAWIYHNYSYRGFHLEAQVFAYPLSDKSADACVGKTGQLADHLRRRSAGDIPYSVTTPANYRGDYRHPLLVVWAPSGFNPSLSERFTGLTGQATARGYVVVYVASVPLGFKALKSLAGIPGEVMKDWCIDAERVYYTGHSDGGTVSNALAVLPERQIQPMVIAPSAMGIQASDMEAYSCPRPTHVMLMHNLGDNHFPDYGAGVAQWWAACNRCEATPVAATYPECVEFPDCAEQVRTLYCQAKGNHAYWPGFDHDMMAFFEELHIQVNDTFDTNSQANQEVE